MRDSELVAHLDKRIEKFKGQATVLESAIGALILGRRYGWKVLYLVHDKKTIRKYEDILGLKFREALEPESDLSNKSLAFRLQKKISNFWKAVSGEMRVVYKGEERSARDGSIGK